MTHLVVLTCALTLGGWGAGGCGPVGPQADYEWRRYPADPGRSYLFRKGVQVAGYDHDGDVYRAYDAARGTWGPPEEPPWKTEAESRQAVPNFGVDTDKLNGGDERYRLNGTAVTREQAQQALAGGRIPDDAARPRLTVIGTQAQTSRVASDLASAPALAEWKERLVLQSYLPEHWAVARAGFVTTGRPTIYLQAPDGKVLHRQDDYEDGPDGLARALRRADPAYDSRKDPDLRRLPLRPNLDLSAIPTPALVLAAGGLYLAWRRRSRNSQS